jgi:uncharacterized membrane protein
MRNFYHFDLHEKITKKCVLSVVDILLTIKYCSRVCLLSHPVFLDLTMNEESETEITIALELEKDLLDRYGLLLTGDALIRELGYVSKAAFRQSLVRKTVPVPIFEIDNRRGKYALAKDVARYLAKKRFSSIS